MKKNITINLCGRLFQIDEDAYEMLQHYTDSLRTSFGKQEGGEEQQKFHGRVLDGRLGMEADGGRLSGEGRRADRAGGQ